MVGQVASVRFCSLTCGAYELVYSQLNLAHQPALCALLVRCYLDPGAAAGWGHPEAGLDTTGANQLSLSMIRSCFILQMNVKPCLREWGSGVERQGSWRYEVRCVVHGGPDLC